MNIAPGPQESVRLSWFRQLDSQLVIVIASTVLISFIVLGGVISARTRSSMLGRELNYLSTLSSTYAQHLSQQVDKTRSIVNAYSFDNNLREALLEGDTRQSFFLLGYAREASAYLEDIVLADLDGEVLVSGSLRMEGESIANYPAFSLAVESGSSAIGTVASVSRAQAPSIGIAAPIIQDGRVIGALLGVFNLERFGIDFLTSSLPGDLYEVFVVDESGSYVIHPRRGLILQPVEEGLYEQISRRSGEGESRVFGPGTRTFRTGDRYFAIAGTTILPWYLGVSVDQSSLGGPLNRILLASMFIALMFALGLAFILYYYLRALIVTPVLSLRERVAHFDGTGNAIKPEFRRNNELRLLEQQLALMSSDITERNQRIATMYNQLLQAEKLASLGGLVAGLSHEMNTPLGNAVTLVSNCREKIGEFETRLEENTLTRNELNRFVEYAGEAVDHVSLNVKRAADLVRDLKQVAVDQGSMRRRDFDLREVTDEVISTIRHRVKRRPISIINDVDEHIALNSYPGPLEQLLTNLISNSLIHGYDENEAGEIRIRGALSDGMVKIEYTDDGHGIPAPALGKIFDPFFTSKMGQGGTGLGLFLVQNIVRGVYRGQIRVKSALGQGVSFFIEFPEVPPEKPRETLDFLSI
jgi:signal transduction histidine kinase